MIDPLLVDGIVIPMNPARDIIENGAVAVDSGRILAVGKMEDMTQQYQARQTIKGTYAASAQFLGKSSPDI